MRSALFLFFIVSLAACNNREKTVPAGASNNFLKPGLATAGQPGMKYFFNPPHGKPGHTCALPVGAPLPRPVEQPAQSQETIITPANVAVDLNDTRPNPKHGEPGHRCDIPVGAPLNTPANGSPNTVTKTSAPGAAALQSVDPNDTRPNPKHGEPGHRCDIPVGTPLNTPAPKPNAALTAGTPVAPAYDPNDTRPNPKHGEPDHRCDIAVGQPLNSNPPRKATDSIAIKGTGIKTGEG